MILPFPGGIARSGSKVGSKYKSLCASTNTAFAPTLRGVVATEMPPDVRCAYEIVIDGLTLEAVERATAAGLHAARCCMRRIHRADHLGQLRRQTRPVSHPASRRMEAIWRSGMSGARLDGAGWYSNATWVGKRPIADAANWCGMSRP